MNRKKNLTDCQKLTPTQLYIKENEYVMSLKRRVITGKKKIKYNHPLLNFLFFIYKLSRNLLSFAIESIKYWKEFIKIKKMKEIKSQCDAIVIGNGPSQGYLSVELLEDFRKLGGEVFTVNFWQQNKKLSTFMPDYVVISDPATLSFTKSNESLKENNLSLLSYLKTNRNIKIIAPLSRKIELCRFFNEDRLINFTDTELSWISSNITPIYPRGYLSMTLYKALAMARWFGYRKIYVIGMDNTYPRNIFCDSDNKILNLEIHAEEDDYVADISANYHNIAELLTELSGVFRDAKKFSLDDKVVNLDEYSLTDAFRKINIQEFERSLKSEHVAEIKFGS